MVAGVDLALTVAGFLVVITVHTVIAVLAIRFLRVRLGSSWAPFIYAIVFIPVVYVPTTVVLGGLLGAGGATVDPGTLFVIAFLLPLAVGVAIDLFWLPAPEAVEVPENS